MIDVANRLTRSLPMISLDCIHVVVIHPLVVSMEFDFEHPYADVEGLLRMNMLSAKEE